MLKRQQHLNLGKDALLADSVVLGTIFSIRLPPMSTWSRKKHFISLSESASEFQSETQSVSTPVPEVSSLSESVSISVSESTSVRIGFRVSIHEHTSLRKLLTSLRSRFQLVSESTAVCPNRFRSPLIHEHIRVWRSFILRVGFISALSQRVRMLLRSL